jgi:hypothetical protein
VGLPFLFFLFFLFFVSVVSTAELAAPPLVHFLSWLCPTYPRSQYVRSFGVRVCACMCVCMIQQARLASCCCSIGVCFTCQYPRNPYLLHLRHGTSQISPSVHSNTIHGKALHTEEKWICYTSGTLFLGHFPQKSKAIMFCASSIAFDGCLIPTLEPGYAFQVSQQCLGQAYNSFKTHMREAG